jgi:hypothetical protein
MFVIPQTPRASGGLRPLGPLPGFCLGPAGDADPSPTHAPPPLPQILDPPVLITWIWKFCKVVHKQNCSHDFFYFIYKCGHRNVLSKRQVYMSIFHIINFKKKKIMDTGVLDFFNKKLILDYYFCLTSGLVFLFKIFIIAPLPLPRDIKLYH